MTIGVKTLSNNYLLCNGQRACYAKKREDGSFSLLREATIREFIWLAEGQVEDDMFNPEFDDFLKYVKDGSIEQFEDETVFNQLPSRFEIEEIFSEIVDEDNSHYVPGLSNNGGCYSYWTERHYVKVSGQYHNLFAWYDTKHSSADMNYCPCCGSFNLHGENPASVIKGDKLLGYTEDDFTGEIVINVY